MHRGKLEIAYRVRALWRRSLDSSLRPGKPATWRRGSGGRMVTNVEVREMQNAETTLAIIRERGRKG